MCLKENGKLSSNELYVKLKAVFGSDGKTEALLGFDKSQAYYQTVRDAK